MADAVPEPVRQILDDPFRELSGPLAAATRMRLELVSSRPLTPHMRRLRLTAPELAGLRFRPGQDVMLLVGTDGSRPVRRRYTIRALDHAARMLTLDVVLHGDGPGERWVRSARPGDTIEGIAPRGKIWADPGADWHLFMTDESGLPAVFAMAEALPGDCSATLVIEVPEAADEQELSAPARTRISWLHRLRRPAGDPGLLAAEAADMELPEGRGRAYLFGEAKVVSAIREILARRGLAEDRMSPKAYWGRGRANAGHGEPARDLPRIGADRDRRARAVLADRDGRAGAAALHDEAGVVGRA
jgi:NADPH-dependent ferric siderophore reductase